ncbi:MAG: EamA family transporter RarD [Opitutaceae bacterium]
MDAQQQGSHGLRGVLSSAGAYLCWGLFPLFWRELKNVDATELIAHRVVWSVVFLMGLTSLLGGWAEVKAAFASAKLTGLHLLSGALLTINWLVYVWSVNNGRVIEMSFGYFLVPLFNVALGKLVLHERLRRLQWLAIALAAVGVALQLTGVGRFPWAGLAVAFSFGFYGLCRKRSPLGSLAGLTMETALYTPLAAAFLLWRVREGTGALGHVDAWQHVLILSAGVITAVPLLLFADGARRLRLSTIGVLQYIGPTLTFVLGVFVYDEAFEKGRLLSFVLIWTALVLYTADNLRAFAQREKK